MKRESRKKERKNLTNSTIQREKLEGREKEMKKLEKNPQVAITTSILPIPLLLHHHHHDECPRSTIEDKWLTGCGSNPSILAKGTQLAPATPLAAPQSSLYLSPLSFSIRPISDTRSLQEVKNLSLGTSLCS